MRNLITYLKTEKASFLEKPFNATDALVLSWLSYISLPENVKGGIKIKELTNDKLLSDEETYGTAFNPPLTKKFFFELRKNARFKDIGIYLPKAFISDEIATQFAAITLKLSENEFFISFRGTDKSYAGWRENFNSAYEFPIPAQQSALDYAKKATSVFSGGQFVFGGHSKGGNLAVYAAINLPKVKQKKITAIYDFDGQGFVYDLKTQKGYEAVKDKISKFVPQSSFVGMIFLPVSDYKIVKSRAISVLQHDPFSWEITDAGELKEEAARTKSSIQTEKAFNAWVLEMTVDERKRMITLIYDALYSLDAKDFEAFFKTLPKQLFSILKIYKALDLDDKDFFKGKIKRFFEIKRQV